MVVLKLALLAQSKKGSNPGCGLSVWSLHVIPVLVWVLSGFFPKSKNIHALGSLGILTLGCRCELVGCTPPLPLHYKRLDRLLQP